MQRLVLLFTAMLMVSSVSALDLQTLTNTTTETNTQELTATHSQTNESNITTATPSMAAKSKTHTMAAPKTHTHTHAPTKTHQKTNTPRPKTHTMAAPKTHTHTHAPTKTHMIKSHTQVPSKTHKITHTHVPTKTVVLKPPTTGVPSTNSPSNSSTFPPTTDPSTPPPTDGSSSSGSLAPTPDVSLDQEMKFAFDIKVGGAVPSTTSGTTSEGESSSTKSVLELYTKSWEDLLKGYIGNGFEITADGVTKFAELKSLVCEIKADIESNTNHIVSVAIVMKIVEASQSSRRAVPQNMQLVQSLVQEMDAKVTALKSKVDDGSLDTSSVQAAYVNAGGNKDDFVVKSTVITATPAIVDKDGNTVQFTVAPLTPIPTTAGSSTAVNFSLVLATLATILLAAF